MTFLVKIKDLVSSGNVRSNVDADLAPSIRENGVLYPLAVYENGGQWIVEEGHRRLMGAIVAGLEEVPCVEVAAPVDEASKTAEQFIINQHRKELSYLDQAQVYYRLVYEFGWSQKRVAEKLAVSETDVSLALSALRAHPIIRDALLEKRISPSAAELVTSLSLEDQAVVAPAVIKARTVRKVSAVIKAHKAAKSSDTQDRPVRVDDTDPMEKMAVDALAEALQNIKLASSVIFSDPAMVSQAWELLSNIRGTAEYMLNAVVEPFYMDAEVEHELRG